MKRNKKLFKLVIKTLKNMADSFKASGDYDLMDVCNKRLKSLLSKQSS